ncbi:hypothetical protein BB561_004230 [Smittium simulii]|uniref:non-specific serine/threonine protein kinase n=1 Tax=Smittium simulii TaxID=133385 RepID=A0A2T9YHD7_9FUNG|nr:hypothetical protein BB561_004230 [Smittium simulii]
MHHTSPNVVGVHYRVGKRIGEGSFGIIYEGTNLLTNTPEPRKTEAPQLKDEFRSYKLLSGTDGIPNAYYFGLEGLYSVLCIDLLGPSLEDMFDICRRKFSVKTTAMIAKQMISRIESVHEHGLVYRDIKPDNFVMGRQKTADSGKVYLIDFGMAKQYRDHKTHAHIPYREGKSLSGTARYMSINTHLGREQSRRDDLQSIGHVIMYFLRGSLPWQGLKAVNTKQKYEKIGEKKQYTSVRELCSGFPEEFAIFLSTVRKYTFQETPDYNYLRDLMDMAIKRVGEVDDGVYDWMSPSMNFTGDSSLSAGFAAKEGKNQLLPGQREHNLHSSNMALVSFHNKTSKTQTGNQQDYVSNSKFNQNSREKISADALNTSKTRLNSKSAQPQGVNMVRSRSEMVNKSQSQNNQYSHPENATAQNNTPQRDIQRRGFFQTLFSCNCFS